MNRSIKILGLLTLLLASVALVIIALNLRTKQTIIVPTSQEVAVAAQPNDSPLPTPPPAKPLAPNCELTVKPVTVVENKKPPIEYIFEPPQVIYTSDSSFSLAGWLPDSRRLLFRQKKIGTLTDQIITLDVTTKELKLYGERQELDAQPVWLEAQQAVAYTERGGDKSYRLKISKGNGNISEALTDLLTPNIGNGADGYQITVFRGYNGELPSVYESDRNNLTEWEFTLSQERRQDLPKELPFQNFPYKIAVSRNPNKVAFYSNTGLYLADFAQRTVCYLSLGSSSPTGLPVWPIFVEWSPDGRQLAMLTTSEEYGLMARYVDLTLLDIQDGTIRSIQPDTRLEHGQTVGPYYVSGISWSPNGQSIVINCPTVTEGRICLINVKHP